MPPKAKKAKKGKKRKAGKEDPTYKLVYFDIEGLAETSRLLLAAKDTEFTDYRYKIEFKDGKAIRPEWEADKKKYDFQKIPVLEFEGQQIPQSRAIESFLAKKLQLYGKTQLEGALIDAIAEQAKDIGALFREAKNKGDDSIKTFWSTTAPEQFGLLEAYLKKGDSGFFVGKRLSLADISVYRLLGAYLPDHKEALHEVLKDLPRLTKLHEMVDSLDGIKAYHEKRQKAKTDAAAPPAPPAPAEAPSS